MVKVSRKDLVLHLANNPRTVRQLAMDMRQYPAEVEEDLRHVVKSLRHQPYRLVVTPATCKRCGFAFGEDRFRKPSKCPECRGTWLTEPIMATESESESESESA